MKDEELLAYNRLGLIPGPEISEEEFEKRAKFLALQRFEVPRINDYDIHPVWVEVFEAKKGLRPWEGGATWIDGEKIRVQIKPHTFYQRSELVVHEVSHAARSSFDEPKFEEFFAYRTSSRRWRRFLGPFFQAPWEVYPFLLASLLYPPALLPLFAYGFSRLIFRHRILQKGAKLWGFPALFRMTDQEIFHLARDPNSFDQYARSQTSLRWRLIHLAYRKKE
jgi:hypothetical protein